MSKKEKNNDGMSIKEFAHFAKYMKDIPLPHSQAEVEAYLEMLRDKIIKEATADETKTEILQ